ncbi:structure-specific endonuclease subunit SLX1 [Angomonas deanei]|nr:structure-specific endonuclease subunit SLX1 [Angomonas deanei]|eukprot:EPY19434.1 structure-specific endonuclease subunit SLX1 [Angomonas deanei]
MDTRFHCVYLLTSLDPQCEGDFYIGYTVDPLRRLRQHNGELVNGAKRTHRHGRPWCIVCCVSGFAEDRTALKFEWTWQHPKESKRLRLAATTLIGGLRRLPCAVAVLHCLLRADLFSCLELTLHIFEKEMFERAAAAAHAYVSGVVSKKKLTVSMFANDPVFSFLSEAQDHPLPCLPPLTTSALFQVEHTDTETFRKTYLQLDTSLLLPSSHTPSPVPEDRASPSRYDHFTEADFLHEIHTEAEQCRQRLLPCVFCGLPLQFLYTARCVRTPYCPAEGAPDVSEHVLALHH